MAKGDNRTLLLLLLIVIAALMLFNPSGLAMTLSALQSIAIIVLCAVATLYLWKRL
jgi:predicted membrane protein